MTEREKKVARIDKIRGRIRYWTNDRKPSMRRSVMLKYLKGRLKAAKADLAKWDKDNRVQGVSSKGLALVKEFEGFYPRVYDDGFGNLTIGYGFLYPREYSKRTITEPEAATLLKQKLDSGSYGSAVRRAIKLAGWQINQNEYDALVSFTFNLGTGWVGNDSWTIWREFKAKSKSGVANALLLYDRANGQTVPGLARRRRAERNLFLS